MPQHEIKRFTNSNTCAECGRPVARLRSWCNNCGRIVCRSHRPYFTSFWQCKQCRDSQGQFNAAQPNPVYPNADAKNQPQAPVAADTVLDLFKTASADMDTSELADHVIRELFDENA